MSPAHSPPPHRYAGRYRAEKLLGRGGMGEVHAVVDESSGQRLALKRLLAGSGERQESAFRREYQALALLKHPHIVEVYDYVLEPGGAFYTMELLQGADLSVTGRRPWREVCRIVRDVASILSLLHARRVVHRDLSPKNIWLLPDGRIKLIDFGAITGFGPIHELVGTPPFVAPEALHTKALDQRSDLYALGALAYWLLTGTHAVAARSMAELEGALRATLVLPGQRLAASGAQEKLPPELDALIEALLHHDPARRPSSAAMLIEQLNGVAELTPEGDAGAALELLKNPALVGRSREQTRLSLALRRAELGRGSALLLEGEQGLGRTRLLHELSVSARLFGITTIGASAASGQRPFGVATSLALRLLESLPTSARAAAEPHLRELCSLSEEVRRRLGVRDDLTQRVALKQDPVELRMRLSAALSAWILRMTASHTLALLVDDVHNIDRESQALLVTLAHEARNHRLLLVVSMPTESKVPTASALGSLRKLSKRLTLKPLELPDSELLLRSMFGSTPYLARLAERLHRETGGNPAHSLLLLEQLVQREVIACRDGLWELPADVNGLTFQDRREARRAQLVSLGREARALLGRLSVARGSLPRALCTALAPSSQTQPDALIDALLAQHILVEADGRLAFAHDAQRELLEAELGHEERSYAHRTLGELLLHSCHGDRLEQLRAGVHLLLGGEQCQSARLLKTAAFYFGTVDTATLPQAAPLLEEALTRLHREHAQPHQTMMLEGALAVAGYYFDLRLAASYGDGALHALSRALKLHWARTLRPVLGRKLSLLVALAVAFVVFGWRRRDPSSPKLNDALLMLFYCASTLAGVGAVCIDAKASQRAADAIEPLAALGKDHVAGFVYDFCSALSETSAGHLQQSVSHWQRILQRLEQAPPRGMPEHLVMHYRGGALLASGVKATWRDGPDALRIADQLESVGMKLYQMSADQLRAGFYANQGQLALYERYKKRLDRHAIQRGTTWQVETWAPNTLMTAATRLEDALLMKRALGDNARLSQHVSAMEPYLQRARGTYCVITRRYVQALDYLETNEEPQSYVAWGRMRGTLARAYNGAGQHARAREVCLHALAHMHPDDHVYVAMNLGVQVELAMAELGLGNHVLAGQQLDALLERYRENGSALTLFTLHEARTRVARAAGDDALAGEQLACAARRAEELNLPTLHGRVARLRRQLNGRPGRDSDSSSGDPSDIVATCLDQLLREDSTGGRSLSSRADLTLSVAMELTGADRGLVLGSVGGSPALLAGGEHMTEQLLTWVEERLASEARAEQPTASDSLEPHDRNVLLLEGAHYRVLPLWAQRGGEAFLVGGLALGASLSVPSTPPREALALMGSRLAELLQAEAQEHTATVS